MIYATTSGIARSIASHLASGSEMIGGLPHIPDAVIDIETASDMLAWVNDDDANDFAGWSPGWQDGPDSGPFVPSDEDWAEFLEWDRSLDGGCGASELSPEEQDLIVSTMDEADYRALQFEANERYQASLDYGL